MSEKIKENDFVEIDYTGKLKNEGYIFDTTEESVAKSNGFFNPKVKYGPVTTCVGKGLVLGGLDASLVGKEPGKEYDVDINAGTAFGKREASLIKLVPLSAFKKQGIKPVPGLQVTLDNGLGVIKTVSGGRVIVDFNHPLAGKDLSYHVKVRSKVTDKKEQIRSILELKLNVKKDDVSVNIADDKKAEVKMKLDLPDQYQSEMIDFIRDCVDVDDVVFVSDDKDKKSPDNKETSVDKEQQTK